MLPIEEDVRVGLRQRVGWRAVVIADHAAAGDGVDLVVSVVMGGGEGAKGLGVVSVGPDLVFGAVAGGGEVAVADGVGVADDLDLVRARRWRREGFFVGGDGESAEGVGGVLAFGGDENFDGVSGLGQAIDGVDAGVGLHEGRCGLVVDDDVEDLLTG